MPGEVVPSGEWYDYNAKYIDGGSQILIPAPLDAALAEALIALLAVVILKEKLTRRILVGLGLGKMHRVVEVEDTPEVRGAIAKLPHMVAVVD